MIFEVMLMILMGKSETKIKTKNLGRAGPALAAGQPASGIILPWRKKSEKYQPGPVQYRWAPGRKRLLGPVGYPILFRQGH